MSPFILMCICLLIGSASTSPPSFVLPTFISRYENLPFGTELFSFTVTDSDPSNTVAISFKPADLIAVSPSSGGSNFTVMVTLKSSLDREMISTHTLMFIATDDDSNAVVQTTKLYVLDVNDNPPTFAHFPQYNWGIPELPYDSSITFTKIHASDPDSGVNGTVRYSILPMTQSNDTAEDYLKTFGIDEFSGGISLKKRLDYSTNPYYQFLVIATDRGTPRSLSTNASLVIHVEDVQNQPPFFTAVSYRTTIQEDISLNTEIIKVTAWDGDTGDSNLLNYTIIKGSCNDSFKIATNDGQISTSRLLDRDSAPIMDTDGVCILTILASEIESGRPQYGDTTATVDVTITITDINDNVPTFTNTTYITHIQENTQRNVPLEFPNTQNINVFDLDQGDNSAMDIRLAWGNGSTCSAFKVAPNTVYRSGSLIIHVDDSSILDFEVTQQLEFRIIATEKANLSHVATATIILNITDENDNSPQFDKRSYAFNVSGDPHKGLAVGVITATDADSDTYGYISYSLLGWEDKFEINKNTGEIRTVSGPDNMTRETIGVFYLTGVATDDQGQGRSNSISVVIEMLSVIDQLPVSTSTTLRTTVNTEIQEPTNYDSLGIDGDTMKTVYMLATCIAILATVIIFMGIVVALIVYHCLKMRKRYKQSIGKNTKDEEENTRNVSHKKSPSGAERPKRLKNKLSPRVDYDHLIQDRNVAIYNNITMTPPDDDDRFSKNVSESTVETGKPPHNTFKDLKFVRDKSTDKFDISPPPNDIHEDDVDDESKEI